MPFIVRTSRMRVPISAIASSALSLSAALAVACFAKCPSPVPKIAPRSLSRSASPARLRQKPLLEPYQNDLMGLISCQHGFPHVFDRRASPFSMPTNAVRACLWSWARARPMRWSGPASAPTMRSMHRISLGAGSATVPQRHPMEAVYYVIGGGGTVRDPDTGAAEALVDGSMFHVEPGTAYVVRGRRRRHRAGRRPLPGRPRALPHSRRRLKESRRGDPRLSPRQARPHAADHLARRAADRLAGRRRDDRQHELRAAGAGRGERAAHPRRIRGHDLHPRRAGARSRISTTGRGCLSMPARRSMCRSG